MRAHDSYAAMRARRARARGVVDGLSPGEPLQASRVASSGSGCEIVMICSVLRGVADRAHRMRASRSQVRAPCSQDARTVLTRWRTRHRHP